MIFDIVSKDFLQIRGMPLRAGNDEVVVTMQPKLEISGVVVDAPAILRFASRGTGSLNRVGDLEM